MRVILTVRVDYLDRSTGQFCLSDRLIQSRCLGTRGSAVHRFAPLHDGTVAWITQHSYVLVDSRAESLNQIGRLSKKKRGTATPTGCGSNSDRQAVNYSSIVLVADE